MTTKQRSQLAQNLVAAREAASMYQAEAARKIGITPVYLCYLESGYYRSPSLPMLRRIAEAYGTTVEKLMKGE